MQQNPEPNARGASWRGARIRAYDSVATKEAARVLGDVPGLSIVDSAAAAL